MVHSAHLQAKLEEDEELRLKEKPEDLKDVAAFAPLMWTKFNNLAKYKPLIAFCNSGLDAISIDKVDSQVNQ